MRFCHAAQVMPPGDMHCNQALQNELQAIEDDREALRWTIGCVIAGYRQRSNAMLQTWYARAALACLIALVALREFFAPLLIFSYRISYLGLAHFLGLWTTGDDYPRLLAVMNATPSWLPVLWIAAGLVILLALWRMLAQAGWKHRSVLFWHLGLIPWAYGGSTRSRPRPA